MVHVLVSQSRSGLPWIMRLPCDITSEIGQRLCDTFEKQERVFIAGYVQRHLSETKNIRV
jgi:hypothetical protein